MSRIEPTVGRIVHVYNGIAGPFAAIITDVSVYAERGLIEAYVFNRHHLDGHADFLLPLVQDDDAIPLGWRAEWMPYQKGQAAKTEQLEARQAMNGDPTKFTSGIAGLIGEPGSDMPIIRIGDPDPTFDAKFEPVATDPGSSAPPVLIQPPTRVTKEDVQRELDAAQYDFTILPNGRTTIAAVTLVNGYTLIGQSSCVARENFNAALGQKYAVEDVERQLWSLLGFRLADARSGRGYHPAYLVQSELSEADMAELLSRPMHVIAQPLQCACQRAGVAHVVMGDDATLGG